MEGASSATFCFGTVAINVWPALAYALVSTPWGGHPSATLGNVQSGIGWVHNSVMLEDIEKCVIRAALKPMPKQVYFAGHKSVHKVGQEDHGLRGLPGILKPRASPAAR